MREGGPRAEFWLFIGALNGFLAIAAGAFGAHALRNALAPKLLEAYETAARYQAYSALAMLAIGLWARQAPSSLVTWAAWLMLAGTVLFSGSLYALALTGVRPLGAITPVGGVSFLASWALLAAAAWQR